MKPLSIRTVLLGLVISLLCISALFAWGMHLQATAEHRSALESFIWRFACLAAFGFALLTLMLDKDSVLCRTLVTYCIMYLMILLGSGWYRYTGFTGHLVVGIFVLFIGSALLIIGIYTTAHTIAAYGRRVAHTQRLNGMAKSWKKGLPALLDSYVLKLERNEDITNRLRKNMHAEVLRALGVANSEELAAEYPHNVYRFWRNEYSAIRRRLPRNLRRSYGDYIEVIDNLYKVAKEIETT